MTQKYRLLDDIDWDALQETKVQIEVSSNYVILKPLKPGASLVILAQAVKSRPSKTRITPNGQPAPTPDVEEALGTETENLARLNHDDPVLMAERLAREMGTTT